MADEISGAGAGAPAEDGTRSGSAEDQNGQGAAAAQAAKSEAPKGPGAEDEVPTRGRSKDFRAGFFIGKKEASKTAGRSETPAQDDDFSDIEDESQRGLAKALLGALERRISPRIESVESMTQEQRDSAEITAFLSQEGNEHFKKYEARARKYVKAHPNYPVAGIFRDLAYDDAMAQGATAGKKADVKAGQQRVGGATKRSDPKAPDFLKMSSQEFKEWKKKNPGRLPSDDE